MTSGAWSLFHDEPLSGNLSATVEAYDALLASGYCTVKDESMKQASQFIRQNGGCGDESGHRLGQCSHVTVKFRGNIIRSL